MKKVITYGTFDLFHDGHSNVLKKAKELGDYLIVGVTGDKYDKERGKLNVQNSLIERIDNVRNTGLADQIIIEEYEGQKIEDIIKFNVDVFAIGSDWQGKFDYLNEYCNVKYIERTKGVSSTQLRTENFGIKRLGIIGSGRIAARMIVESKFVSGVNVEGVFNPNIKSAKQFAEKNELAFYTNDFDEFCKKIDAIYIASPHLTHYDYIVKSLNKNIHVLCEKPITLSKNEILYAYNLANSNNLVLLEAIKTAYSPGFLYLMSLVKSGTIGSIKDIDVTFTKLVPEGVRELNPNHAGGSIAELGSYVLLPIIKIFGTNYKKVDFHSYKDKDVDLYTKGIITYENSIATFKVGLGVKSEGDLIISGTKGYAYVPAPWWKTEYFELRFEDMNQTKKYFYKFDGDGLRYELNEFINMINYNNPNNNYNNKLSQDESTEIVGIIDQFLQNNNVNFI